jgi:hypothetical protein
MSGLIEYYIELINGHLVGKSESLIDEWIDLKESSPTLRELKDFKCRIVVEEV